jgi:hypothetical protein
VTEEQKERMREWVRRLRSGEYQQGVHKLHTIDSQDNHRYCCLGVACEMAVEAGIVTSHVREGIVSRQIVRYHWDLGHFQETMLPSPVADWLGLTDVSPTVKWRSVDIAVATINDDGVDFDTIANALEQAYLRDDS